MIIALSNIVFENVVVQGLQTQMTLFAKRMKLPKKEKQKKDKIKVPVPYIVHALLQQRCDACNIMKSQI